MLRAGKIGRLAGQESIEMRSHVGRLLIENDFRTVCIEGTG